MKANKFLKLKEDEKGFSMLVPMVLAVVITFALLFIGAYVNSTIHQQLNSSSSSTQARRSMNNTSVNFDSAMSIVQVVIIITILAGAIAAIFLFTRYD